MTTTLKKLLKPLVPGGALSAWYTLNRRQKWAELNRCESSRDMFTTIYKRGHWGRSSDPEDPYFSGHGSRDPQLVRTYVEAVRQFLQSQPSKLNAVDLGCGDFKVGSQIRPYCARYIACDVVKEMIDWHSQAFRDLDIEFRILDATEDDLPPGDLAFVRQVLQHLSNDDIQRVIPKLRKYKYLIVTEELPADGNFVPNIDKPRGFNTRVYLQPRMSGVILTEPPFNLNAKTAKVLCEAYATEGAAELIRTTLYEM
jgi:hypothetical protein